MPTVIVLRRLNCWRTLTGACGVKFFNTINRSQLVIFCYFRDQKKPLSPLSLCVCYHRPKVYFITRCPPVRTGTHILYSGRWRGGEAVVPRLALSNLHIHITTNTTFTPTFEWRHSAKSRCLVRFSYFCLVG